MYAAPVSLPDTFRGSIVWDSGQVGGLNVFATEQFNYESANVAVDDIQAQVQALSGTIGRIDCNVTFLRDMTAGRWKLDTTLKQMIFYKEDNTTEVARFDLFDATGSMSTECVYDRQRVGPVIYCA
jgi:hypothetical protein